MGAMGGKGAPAPPNFQGIAQQDLQANRPNQNTPWASSGWTNQHTDEQMPAEIANATGLMSNINRAKWQSEHPGTDHWSQQVNLSPELQQANQEAMGQLQNAWATPLDNGQQARSAASNAMYGQATSRLDPQWQQRQHDMQVELANQGADPNSAAYATAMGNFDRGRNDAYQQANYGSIIGGGQEAQRQQQMDLASRAAPLMGMEGLRGLTGMPGFAQSGMLPAAMAQYQAALQNYGIQQQGKNSSMGGLMNLGGTLGGAYMMSPYEL